MPRQFKTIQKLAFGFAALFLGVYSLDYVPGIMDQNGLMFGLFHMSKLIDLGHLALGALALISAFVSAKISRLYFCALGVWYTIDVVTYFFGHLQTLPLKSNILVNLPHTLVFLAAYWIGANVDKPKGGEATA
ncbi:MAG TPA: hypothetical protein VGT24_06710 [Candidatus Acidoferrales bacterium]|nr:hypothetical protein [Candidatus Acidoferrales bacterium]